MLLSCGAGEDPWESLDCKEIQPVTLREISPEYSLEGLLLQLKLQYFDHLMWRANSLENTVMLGKMKAKEEEKGAAEDEMVGWHHRLNGHECEQTLKRQWRTGEPDVLQFMGLQRVGHDLATEQQKKPKWKVERKISLSLGENISSIDSNLEYTS